MSTTAFRLGSAFTIGAAVLAQAPALPAQDPRPSTSPGSIEDRLRALEEQVRIADVEREALRQEIAKKAGSDKAAKWSDKLSIRGYGQVRYTTLFDEDNTPNLNVPNDRSVNEAETLMLRRGRVILSGDVTDHLFVYAQMDFAGSNGAPDQTVQMRDFYADIAFDADKEFRLRPGVSKVPFGWVNMQSSQNRGPIERPDALNSAVEGERDFGAFFYWAPKATRELLRDLVRSGRKGSGDYGVIGFGPYSGQGLNRSDANGDVHWVARASYPFALESGQVVELGVQGYTGDFVTSTQAIGGITPVSDPDGVRDERYGVTAVWYPQPFGLEAEWVWGSGPTLATDGTRITSEYLQGGYVQASLLQKGESGTWFPFVRWNYFDGSRKFARNAPRNEVNEIDLGFEFSPWPEVEFTMMYTHTFWRTDTSAAPFGEARDDDRIGFQVQFNF
ncbi:MAG: OprO/OprP family phosphate-selective porin [Planctomycetes bacterium]|nr:OprO/OprP family phosphate-selective porin [Planctomycetota bacterium]